MSGLTPLFNNPSTLFYLGLAILIPVVCIVWLLNRARNLTRQRRRSQLIIRELFPDLPERNIIIPNGSGFYGLWLILVSAALFLSLFIALRVPTVSFLLISAISALGCTILVTLIKRLLDRRANPTGVFVRSLRVELITTVGIVLYLITIQAGGNQLSQWLSAVSPSSDSSNNGTIITIYTILVLLVIPYILLRFFNRRGFHVMALIKAASYDQAVAEIDAFRQTHPNVASWLSVQGLIFLLIGRFDEAQTVLRNALALGLKDTPTNQSAMLINLAGVLAEAKRYVEAKRLYEAAFVISPASSTALNGVAAIYLAQGIQVDEAFKLLGQAYYIRSRNISRDRVGWSLILAHQAWALTLMGRSEHNATIERLIDQALAETDRSFKAGFAALQYRIGCIRALRREKPKAAQHFNQAIQIDPACYAAHLAAEALQKL